MLCLVLTACTVGPVYERPTVTSGDDWSTVPADNSEAANLESWWQHFRDPVLSSLIEQARRENLDLRQGVTRIAEARALRDVAIGRRYPSLDAGASISEIRRSENGSLPVKRIPGFETEQTVFETGFDARWELDLFGRIQQRVDVGTARVEESEALYGDLLLSVTAEVARSYFELRGAQQELAAMKSGIQAAEQKLAFVKTRARLGEIPTTEVALNETELATLKSSLPLLESLIKSHALALGILTGNLPEQGLSILQTTATAIQLHSLPVGQRADILSRRPDLRAAERRLAAATAETALAHAELYPKLVISAAGGFESLSGADLFTGASGKWLLAPILSWRIFDGGRVRAEIRASEARTRAAALAFEKTVIEALGEAEQALLAYHFGLLELDSHDSAMRAAQKNYQIATIHYQAGDTSRLEVLNARRLLSEVKQRHARSYTRSALALVSLFKALGGGWE